MKAHLDHEVAHRWEAAAVDGLLLGDGEPDLDQVQPRPAGRGEVDLDPGIRGQPGLHLRMLVRRIVVHHQVQIDVGIGGGEMAQEGQELLVAMSRLAYSGDLPGGDLERGEQGGGAVPDVDTITIPKIMTWTRQAKWIAVIWAYHTGIHMIASPYSGEVWRQRHPARFYFDTSFAGGGGPSSPAPEGRPASDSLGLSATPCLSGRLRSACPRFHFSHPTPDLVVRLHLPYATRERDKSVPVIRFVN
jgi:hypothetical protein